MPVALPIVYSCSGCSSAAQMANQLALWLDRDGYAQMSCIAGVGGGVPGLVRLARSGRPIVALDGCPLQCTAACLRGAGVRADVQVTLSDFGVKKLQHADFDPAQARQLYEREVAPPVAAARRAESAATEAIARR
ncbi:MAG: putative zinc-binding protein [Polyangiaceae bacterium]|nr:putative zinc-binding protein [Polyangiaceae bacterium]